MDGKSQGPSIWVLWTGQEGARSSMKRCDRKVSFVTKDFQLLLRCKTRMLNFAKEEIGIVSDRKTGVFGQGKWKKP